MLLVVVFLCSLGYISFHLILLISKLVGEKNILEETTVAVWHRYGRIITVHLEKVCDFKTSVKHFYDNFKLKKCRNWFKDILQTMMFFFLNFVLKMHGTNKNSLEKFQPNPVCILWNIGSGSLVATQLQHIFIHACLQKWRNWNEHIL